MHDAGELIFDNGEEYNVDLEKNGKSQTCLKVRLPRRMMWRISKTRFGHTRDPSTGWYHRRR